MQGLLEVATERGVASCLGGWGCSLRGVEVLLSFPPLPLEGHFLGASQGASLPWCLLVLMVLTLLPRGTGGFCERRVRLLPPWMLFWKLDLMFP